MTMEPGTLDRRVEIQEFNPVQNQFGEEERHDDSNWDVIDTVWAAIEPESAASDESYSSTSDAEVIRKTAMIRMRHYPGLDARDYRIRDTGDDTIYDIQGFANEEKNDEKLVIEATRQE